MAQELKESEEPYLGFGEKEFAVLRGNEVELKKKIVMERLNGIKNNDEFSETFWSLLVIMDGPNGNENEKEGHEDFSA